MNKNYISSNEHQTVEELSLKAFAYIDEARDRVQRSVNSEMVKAYWLIGRDIYEAEQKGEARAAYGSYLLQTLSQHLTKRFGKGFSVSTLKDIRQFYLSYPDLEISHALRGQSEGNFLNPNLSWIHYRALMRIERTEKSAEMAKYMLGEKAKQIFASKYQLYLPTEEQLRKEIKREVSMIQQQQRSE